MIPLLLFLLAVAAVYLGTIEAAFSALMRLSLRLMAERSGRDDRLGFYLDDPLLLFVPARLLLGLVFSLATVLLARADRARRAADVDRHAARCASRSSSWSASTCLPLLIVRPQSRSASSRCCCRRSTSSRGCSAR